MNRAPRFRTRHLITAALSFSLEVWRSGRIVVCSSKNETSKCRFCHFTVIFFVAVLSRSDQSSNLGLKWPKS